MSWYIFDKFESKHPHWNNFNQFIKHFYKKKPLIAHSPTNNLSQNRNLHINYRTQTHTM